MSILTYPLGFIGGGKEFYNNVMENSLRFEHSDGAYLSWTPSADGNRKTHTFSCWFKSHAFDVNDQPIFSADGATQNYDSLRFNSGGTALFIYLSAGVHDITVSTAAGIRDPSAWYHVVMAFNTPAAAAADRLKFWINGKLQTLSTHPSQNYETGWNKAVLHHIGKQEGQSEYFKGLIGEVYFIDGHQLGPENFGEYKEGVWIPKAYAGPPPIITDSSSGNLEVTNTTNITKIDYDEYYIGDSSIEFDGTTTDSELRVYGGNTANYGTNSPSNNFTIDLWLRRTSYDEASGLLSNMGPDQTGWNLGIFADGQPYFRFGNGSWIANPVVAGDTSGFESFDQAQAENKWRHISVTREEDTYKMYIDGILASTGINTTNISDQNTHLRIGRFRDADVQIFQGYMDEIRIVKGDARPPRFYFGTTYGDQSGGVMAHRATSAHRFTDDERTTLLVSGQNANGHARAVSLVDESGLHLDNVHLANSSLSNYPTQDGIGKQFTISGAQHTTKESFVGNTSSILVDGIDDAVSLPSGHSVPAGTTTRTVDYWIKVHDHSSYGYTFGSGTSSPSASFGISARGSTSANHDYYFQGYGTGDFDLPKPLAEVSQDWQHLQVTWDGTTTKVYVDGVFANSKNNSINTGSSAFEIGRNGRGGTEYIGIYFDEFRASTSVEPPQIKWTHTQTAGAGNKDAYDVHGWRGHGHEFSDDNATSLLIHGDAYVTIANSFYRTLGTTDATKINLASEQTLSSGPAWSFATWFRVSDELTSGAQANWFGDGLGGNSDAGYIAIYANKLAIWSNGNSSWGYGNTVVTPGEWHSAAFVYNGTGTLYFYLDGLSDGHSSIGTANENLVLEHLLWSGNDSYPRYFYGEVAQMAFFDGELTPTQVGKIHLDGVNTSLHGIRTTFAFYDFGNAFSGSPDIDGTDSSTAIFDRSGNNRDGTRASGTGSLITSSSARSNTYFHHGGSLTFQDSSSANSIHHALVSGGGIHHTKAVTLKSDGTNGTSTTDEHGNTIFWCGSNSTVTFANSSSFDYGNTSFFHSANNTMYVGANPDWDLAAEFTVSCWAYISSTQSSHPNHGLWCARGDAYEGPTAAVATSGGQAKVTFVADDGGTAPWHTALETSLGDFPFDSWNYVEYNRDANNLLTISVNGIVKASATNSTNFYYSGSHALRIGRGAVTDSQNQAMTGYMDEFMYMTGGNTPSRFYLGNQAPESGASFTTVKAHNFDGTEYMTTSDPFTNGSLTNREIVMWFQNNSTGSPATYILNNINSSSYINGFYLYRMQNNLRIAAYNSSSATTHYSDNIPFLQTGLQHLVVQVPDDVTSEDCKVYINGNLVYDTTLGSTGPDSYGSVSADQLRIAYTSSATAQVDMVQLACYEGTFHTAAEVKSMFDLGPTGNLLTSFSPNMVSYHGFGNLDAVNALTTSAATADTTAIVYDRKSSGAAKDFAQSSAPSAPTQSTFYYPSNSAKRLAHGPLLYTANPTSNTAILGNTHYANTKANFPSSDGASTFGSFVDDEYTVLLLRGGHADGNTVFFDSNTAAGETITFPAHSYSSGKTRVAKEIVNSGTVTHEITNQLGLHGSSIKGAGGGQKLMIPYSEDFDLGADGGDFTIEFWGYVPSGYTNNETIASFDGAGQNTQTGSGGVNNGGWILGYGGGTSGTTPMINFHAGGEDGTTFDYAFDGTVSVGVNSWHHYAVIMRNGIVEPFVNGVSYPNTQNSGGAKSNEQPADNDGVITIKHKGDLWFFDWSYTWADFDGLIDEFRITKGIARYTPDGASQSGIVPSTATGAGSTGSSIPTNPYLRPTPYVATDGGRGYFSNTNVKIWVKSDTFPGDTDFYDSSATIGNAPKDITNADYTAANRPVIKTANSVTDYALSGGADGILFDNTDYIVVPNHEGLQLGNSDFTIEFWIRAGSATSGIMGTCNSGDGRKGFRFFLTSSATTMNFYASTVDSGNDFTLSDNADPSMVADHWHHVVQQRIGDEFNMIIDGVSAVRGSSSILIPDNGNIYIGGTGSTADSELVGYLDEIRFSKMARYTGQGLIDSDFPNPSTEFGIQTEGSTYGRFDTQVTANTTYQRYNYQHGKGVSFSNFGDHSDYAGGGTIGAAGAVVGSPAGSGNFCIAWWQNADVAAYSGVWGMGNGTGGYLVISAFGQSSTQDIYISGDGSNWNIHSGDSGAPPAKPGEWEFRAISRQGTNSIKFYHNGIVTKEITTRTDGTAIGSINQSSSAVLNIGRDSSNNKFDGKMSQWGMWHKGLSDAEIQDLYFAGPGLGVNWRTGAGISGTNYTSDDGTAANLYLYFDMNNNPDDYSADDTTMTDRSANARGSNGTSSDFDYEADTKLLIHSNTDIDGDTSIVDSSASEHVIDRVVTDPVYANATSFEGSTTALTRSSVTNGEMGIRFNQDWIQIAGGEDGLNFGSGNWTAMTWHLHDASEGNHDHGVFDGGYYDGAINGGWGLRLHRTTGIEFYQNNGTSIHTNVVSGTDDLDDEDKKWRHYLVGNDGTNARIFLNGTQVASASFGGNSPYGTGNSSFGLSVGKIRTGVGEHTQGFLDQIAVYKGCWLGNTHGSSISGGGTAGSRPGNTHIGALGGLIVHEEYANTTTTANATTTLLLHSNNATHHSQGSRKFYNDVVNTAFYGAGTFSATPAAAPKGHEAAGYFVVTAASGEYKFSGNTQSTTIEKNPQLRLRRGYSYIFDFTDGTNSGHEFYFANSTANSTGFAYGMAGDRSNSELNGVFGTNTDPNGAPAVTWTQLTTSNHGGNSGTGGTYQYIKYEVPTDAPKNLYYRCSNHSTMGNAVFVMEATEPAPLKVGTLPALKTSGFNDRDWGGIGNSVIHFSGPATPNIVQGIFVDGDGTDLYWPAGTAFVFECWFNSPDIGTTQTVNWFSTESFFPGTTGMQIRSTNNDGIQMQMVDGTTQTYEVFFASSETGASNRISEFTSPNKWHHLVVQRDSSNDWTAYLDARPLDATASGSKAQNINTSGQGVYIGGATGTGDAKPFEGFMQDIMLYKGVSLDANTVTQNYMTGRAGSFRTANSSVAVHIKSDAPYGSRTFTDVSPNALTTSTVVANTSTHDIYHHIEDDRTANTALYFDGYSAISLPMDDQFKFTSNDFTAEAWIKPDDSKTQPIIMGVWGNPFNWALQLNSTSDPAPNDANGFRFLYESGTTITDTETTAVIDRGTWGHVAVSRYNEGGTKYFFMFVNGVCIKRLASATIQNDGTALVIGAQDAAATSQTFVGWMDGIRITNGMSRYTSGIPTDGQSPAKDYDDGRSSNVSSNTWATSSTRHYYGINTHTYLQTTQYSTDANTVLLIRGDDAETANDGVNMYGNNGFHLEFKEVGSGDERDYNNFNTGVNGLGSDTSATQEFADDATVLLVRSRPNQANGSVQFVDETNQDTGSVTGTAYHNTTKTIFGIDSNTANVSVASGGSGTY